MLYLISSCLIANKYYSQPFIFLSYAWYFLCAADPIHCISQKGYQNTGPFLFIDDIILNVLYSQVFLVSASILQIVLKVSGIFSKWADFLQVEKEILKG